MKGSGLNKFGQSIKKNRDLLAQRFLKSIENQPESICLCRESQFYPIEDFFKCLGEALCHDEQAGLELISQWANQSWHRYVQSQMKTQSRFPSQKLNAILLDYVEEHQKRWLLDSAQILNLLKRINQYIDYTESFINQKARHKLLNDLKNKKHLLDDELITIKELNDLIIALKEATIFAVTGKNDAIIYANEKFCEISKYSIEELLGNTHFELLFSGYHELSFFVGILDDIRAGKVWKGEICNKAKDGSLYWVDTTIVPFLNGNGELYEHISIMFDITEKKKTEEMLNKTEKLSLIGELAAGFAHEIRNPLTTIRGFVQIMESFTDEKRRLYSKTILDEIDRINSIVSEFMVFAKPHAIQFSQCNLVNIVKNVVEFIRAEALLKNVEIVHAIKKNRFYIRCERHQLVQVFVNLIKNAIDSLPKGGKITIDYTVTDHSVGVAIKDNGLGMTAEEIKRIGEPFFTTKENGNGLGLMVSYKIIENHHGKVECFSKVNQGTTFLITFPLLKNIGERHEHKNNRLAARFSMVRHHFLLYSLTDIHRG